jgi:hypothetical protein
MEDAAAASTSSPELMFVRASVLAQSERTGRKRSRPSSARSNSNNNNSSYRSYEQGLSGRFSDKDIQRLRLPASSVAACCGYHEYTDVLELLMTLLYQDLPHVLQADLECLDLEVETKQVLSTYYKPIILYTRQHSITQLHAGLKER